MPPPSAPGDEKDAFAVYNACILYVHRIVHSIVHDLVWFCLQYFVYFFASALVYHPHLSLAAQRKYFVHFSCTCLECGSKSADIRTTNGVSSPVRGRSRLHSFNEIIIRLPSLRSSILRQSGNEPSFATSA